MSGEEEQQQPTIKPAESEISPTIKDSITHSQFVHDFIERLRSIVITDSLILGPRGIFYLTVVASTIPIIWSILQVAISSLPDKLYFDGCIDRTTQTTYNLTLCVSCCNDRTTIFTNLIPVPDKANTAKIVTIVVACVVGALAGPAFSRLQLMEHMSYYFLAHGVVIKSPFELWQLLPIVVWALLFGMIAGLALWTQMLLADTFVVKDHAVTLGYGDVCDATSTLAGKQLHAIFNETNPSLAASNLPLHAWDRFKLFILVFVPFIPFLAKIAKSATTTFTELGIQELLSDAEGSNATFGGLKYEVEEEDLMDALVEYAERIEDEETCSRIVRRILVLRPTCGHPLPEFFGFSWGTTVDVQQVLSIVLRNGKLLPYTGTGSPLKAGEEMKPTEPVCEPAAEPVAADSGDQPTNDV